MKVLHSGKFGSVIANLFNFCFFTYLIIIIMTKVMFTTRYLISQVLPPSGSCYFHNPKYLGIL